MRPTAEKRSQPTKEISIATALDYDKSNLNNIFSLFTTLHPAMSVGRSVGRFPFGQRSRRGRCPMLSHIWGIFSLFSSFSFSAPPQIQVSRPKSQFFSSYSFFFSVLPLKSLSRGPNCSVEARSQEEEEEEEEEEKEKVLHVCERIGHRPLWGRCPAPPLDFKHNTLRQGTLLRLFTFSAVLGFLSILLLPRCPSELLQHCSYPPARD